MPPGEQRLSRQRLPTDRPKLSYWLAGSGDRYLLALGNPIDHLAAMVPQLADRDVGHGSIVSRVIPIAVTHHQSMRGRDSSVMSQGKLPTSAADARQHTPTLRPSADLAGCHA